MDREKLEYYPDKAVEELFYKLLDDLQERNEYVVAEWIRRTYPDPKELYGD